MATATMNCDETGQKAPQTGCKCRECINARGHLIDPELRKLAFEPRLSLTISPSSHILHDAINRVVMDDMDVATMHIEIIKALAAALDKEFKERIDQMRKQPPRLVVFP